MSAGYKAAEAPAADAGAASQPKKPSSRSARLDRLLSGLGAGALVDVDPDKVKGDIRRWAKGVAALVRQLSFGAWPEKATDRRSADQLAEQRIGKTSRSSGHTNRHNTDMIGSRLHATANKTQQTIQNSSLII